MRVLALVLLLGRVRRRGFLEYEETKKETIENVPAFPTGKIVPATWSDPEGIISDHLLTFMPQRIGEGPRRSSVGYGYINFFSSEEGGSRH